ncbi:MAG: type II toxin-antitoxin system RelE/ParE family toxin [Anaerolineae bacterium]|nr:type II toxin-antitoxin system RelE/ParE family toxin [Anaerolineae bacterium]MBL8106955.1 type II toxin-antitoxin system RelE/ParE family toxin [Anaerolineales bacterium]MCC7188056.1 type II toxin-antitoxin system RelE/ParE family toxin [Anaerolineales bacterium]
MQNSTNQAHNKCWKGSAGWLDQTTHHPLTGTLKGIFKLRAGDYRALYTFDGKEQTITVHMVKHRREVYKTK